MKTQYFLQVVFLVLLHTSVAVPKTRLTWVNDGIGYNFMSTFSISILALSLSILCILSCPTVAPDQFPPPVKVPWCRKVTCSFLLGHVKSLNRNNCRSVGRSVDHHHHHNPQDMSDEPESFEGLTD
jgi:hypothetical protein